MAHQNWAKEGVLTKWPKVAFKCLVVRQHTRCWNRTTLSVTSLILHIILSLAVFCLTLSSAGTRRPRAAIICSEIGPSARTLSYLALIGHFLPLNPCQDRDEEEHLQESTQNTIAQSLPFSNEHDCQQMRSLADTRTWKVITIGSCETEAGLKPKTDTTGPFVRLKMHVRSSESCVDHDKDRNKYCWAQYIFLKTLA